jgi:hypothetical protein
MPVDILSAASEPEVPANHAARAVDAERCAELLDDGQEEVFSRTAVELGRIEHHHSEED